MKTELKGYMNRYLSYQDKQPVVLDIETDGTDPHSGSCSIVMIGVKWTDDDGTLAHEVFEGETLEEFIGFLDNFPYARGDWYWVGHNISFDTQFIFNKLDVDIRDYAPLFDTMVAEYLLSGQTEKMASLDRLASIYSLKGKNDIVKEMFKQGIKASEIDKDVLHDYLLQDLDITFNVWKKQLPLLVSKNLLTLFGVQMSALEAYIELEINGLKVDINGLKTAHFTCEQQLNKNHARLHELLEEMGISCDANPLSNHTISTVVFGAPGIKYTEREKVGVYKNGKEKFKNIEKRWTPAGYLSPTFFDATKMKTGCYDVSDSMLDKVCKAIGDASTSYESRILEYIEVVRDTRKIQKADSTYFVPLLEAASTSYDGRVHPSINCAVTNTGRTSSSNPNMQNIPPFAKRFVQAVNFSKLVEFDFKQLEVVGLAILSMDKRLIQDLKSGADVHYETGKEVYKWKDPTTVDKRERRIVKGVNFGLIYGGGPVTISNQTGTDPELVKKLIAAFYKRYPRVKEWQREVLDAVEAVALVTPESPVVAGQHARVSKYHTETGRIFTFTESEVPKNFRKRGQAALNFKPTEPKNYPVQGFATGDIFPLFLGYAHYIMMHYNGPASVWWKTAILAAVHDSVLYATPDGHTDTLVNFIQDVVSNHLPELLWELWKIEVPVPFVIEHEIKDHW